MNIDEYWLDDNKLADISRRIPSTNWGKELMREAWPKFYAGLVSSDTYRGCAIVVYMLYANVHKGISLVEIVQLIEGVDQSIKISKSFPPNTHRTGGAVLTITSAWERAHSGLTADQLVVAFETELIYATQMFMKARQLELAGEQPP